MRLYETTNLSDKELLKNFVEWWKERAPNDMVGTDGTLFDDENFWKNLEVVNGRINCGWRITIHDNNSTKLPFQFGEVASMRLFMSALETFEGAPLKVGVFSLENWKGKVNQRINSLVGLPQQAQHITVETLQPLESLQTTFTGHCESFWLQAPFIKSWAGFAGKVEEMSIVVKRQQNVSSIRQLRGIERLALVLPDNFNAGLLGIAMIPGLQSVGGASKLLKQDPHDAALEIINKGMKAHKNVHDIQEDLIESGLTQFARL